MHMQGTFQAAQQLSQSLQPNAQQNALTLGVMKCRLLLKPARQGFFLMLRKHEMPRPSSQHAYAALSSTAHHAMKNCAGRQQECFKSRASSSNCS